MTRSSFLWTCTALIVLLLFLFLSPAQARCSLPCGTRNPNIFPVSLPNGETYDSFYSWLTAPSTGIFAEGTAIATKWVAQYTVDPNIYFLPNIKPCAINVTFVSSVTSARNRIGWFQFNKNGPVGGKIIAGTNVTLFADATKAILTGETEPCVYQGSTVTLGPFSDSISLGFYLDLDGQCKGANATRLYSLDEENLKYDTTNWNPTTKPYGRTVAVVRVRHSLKLVVLWATGIVTHTACIPGSHSTTSLPWLRRQSFTFKRSRLQRRGALGLLQLLAGYHQAPVLHHLSLRRSGMHRPFPFSSFFEKSKICFENLKRNNCFLF
jgi:hypothetical protein